MTSEILTVPPLDRFHLETKILNCWSVVDDIQLICNRMEYMDADARMNSMIGLKAIYALKFDDLWETFEKLIADKKII
jgi:hypothetical protein